jgi:hypothetical protein
MKLPHETPAGTVLAGALLTIILALTVRFLIGA